ncbi:Spo0B domain-containing protein [Microbacteriaceae bacterium VKM Ac-2855]|nr:Spo0B domain-containing protein [Microbacteriaceae bacterium VKM Ac-2855]
MNISLQPRAGSPHRLLRRIPAIQASIVAFILLLSGVGALALVDQQLTEVTAIRLNDVATIIADDIGDADDPDVSRLTQQMAAVDVAFVIILDPSSTPRLELGSARIPLTSLPASTSRTLAPAAQLITANGQSAVVARLADGNSLVVGEESGATSGRFWTLTAMIVGIYVVTGAASWCLSKGISRFMRKRVYDLEPEEIKGVLDQREVVFASIDEGILAVDSRGRIVLLNPAAALLIERSADIVGGDAAKHLDPQVFNALYGPTETDQLALIGERVLILRVFDAPDAGGNPGRMAVVRDRSELFAAANALESANSLADGLRARTHEFANRMHLISGLLELGQLDTVRQLITTYTNGSPLSADHDEVQIADWEIIALVQRARARAGEQGIRLVLDEQTSLPGLSPPRFGDRVSVDVATVLGILLDNALEACDDGGTVRLLCDLHGGMVRIRIDDDGPGILDTNLHKIFDRGYSTKPNDRFGRGIGLSLAQRIAARNRGRIDASRSPLGGARFTVLLSARPANADESHEENRTKSDDGRRSR